MMFSLRRHFVNYLQIKINNDLSFNVSSFYRENNKSRELTEYYFKDLLTKLNIDIKFVRLVEASLFFFYDPLTFRQTK
jgi:hypothetical protein